MSSSGQWTPPRELLLPTPRPVKRTSWLAAARGQGIEFGVAALVPIFALCALLGLPFVSWGDKLDRLPKAIKIVSGAFALGGFLGVPISIVIVLFFLPTTCFTLRRTERLLNRGRPTRAVVTSVYYHEASGRYGTVGRWFSTIEYPDDSGNNIKREMKRKLIEGDIWTVLYDPNKPKRFIIYPAAGYEVGEPKS